MISKNTIIKILFNTILGIVLILVWLQFVDINQIFTTISKVSLFSLIPVVFFMFLSPFIRAVRLQIFLRPIKKIPLRDLVFLNGASLFFNFLIPIRAGEVVKGVYLNNKYQLPFAKSLIWILLDRFIDFLVVLALGSILLLVVPTSLNTTVIIFITIILFMSLILTYLIVYKAVFAEKLFKFLSNLLVLNIIKIYFERIYKFFLSSFTILRRSPKDLFLLFFITVLGYAADSSIWYFTFLSLNSHQDFLKMYLSQLLSALTYLVPAAPGYVGSAEASGALILSGVFGIDTNLASAMIVLFHIVTAVFVMVFGMISLYFLKINPKTVIDKLLKRPK